MNIQSLGRFLKTTSDAQELQQILEKVSDDLYKTDKSAEESLIQAIHYELGVQLEKMAAENGVGLENKAAAKEFFTQLQAAINKLPVVTITLAVYPKTDLILHIHDWFYSSFHMYVLLAISVKPEIIGGCIVSVNGKYFEHTLQKQASQVLGAEPGARF